MVEDERRLAQTLQKGFIEDGFAVDIAYDGEEGQYLAESEEYDLIILDLMLPKVDGLALCQSLRSKDIKTPVLMLTARSTVEDKVTGLDSGADDYLVKPFSFIELRSRVHALIRRSKQEATSIYKMADLCLDSLRHQVSRDGKNIKLTPKEFSVLEFLIQHKDEVVTRTMITEHIWDYNFEGMSNVVDVFMAAIRRKIDNGSKFKLLHTVHGVGYKISEKP